MGRQCGGHQRNGKKRAVGACLSSDGFSLTHAPPFPHPQFKKVAPLGDRVFVKVDAAEVASAGGILLPSAAQERATAGVVTARGGKAGAGLADGDRVVYSAYAGTEVKMGSEAYVLLKVRAEKGEGVGGGGEKKKKKKKNIKKKLTPHALPTPPPPS